MIISFPGSQLSGQVDLPASKSISHRVQMIRALCREPFIIENLSKSNDTEVLGRLLNEVKQDSRLIRLYAEDAGTPFRFLLSFLAFQDGREFILEGSTRMNERPIKPLVDALCSLGARIFFF